MVMNRRSFLFGAGALAAPAIIRPGILMPVSVWREPLTWQVYRRADGRTTYVRADLLERAPTWVMDYLTNPPVNAERGEPIITLEEALDTWPPVDAPEQTCA